MITEQEVPTRDRIALAETWDLSEIFTSVDAFMAAMAEALTRLDDVLAFRGRLGESALVLREAYDAAYRLQLLLERINVYVRLSYDEDTTNSEAQARLDEATSLSIRIGQQVAWFDPEVIEIPEDRLNEFLADPLTKPYRYVIDDVVRNRPHTRSHEVEELLVMTADLARVSRDSFGALDNADLEYGEVKDEDGELVQLTKGRYLLLQESRNRDVRRGAYDVFMAAYQRHKHVLASLHAGSVRKDVFYARARGFESAREAALFANAIDESVYDTLIDVTRGRIEAAGRYLELRRRILGVDQLEIYDSWVPLAELPVVNYAWPEAVELVCEGLAAMGDDYVDKLRAGMTAGRWVDVHETKGKRSGAYSWGAYGSHPVILMNWNGTLSDVFTLAHEAGHAMHTYLSNEAQPYQDAHYPIFLAEIASTLNEVLLMWHLLGRIPAEEKMKRFAILNRFADQIMGTHIRQTMFAEYERETHRTVESGQPLTLHGLSEIYNELYRFYTPGMNVDERAALGWARVPHFYNGFYVYQYATGISAGIALAKAVRDEGSPAVERVMRLLSSGGKDYPLSLLREAGVDLTTGETINACMDVFGETVTELEAIVESGAFSSLV